MTGRWFGKLKITGPAGPEDGPLPATAGGWWRSVCVCGRGFTAPAEAYLGGRLTSCGRPTPEDRAQLAEAIATRQPPPRI
jgi:hypothetical protein